MTYQIVGSPRMGTSFLANMALIENNYVGLSEFFEPASESVLNKDFSHYTIDERFKYLEECKLKNIHYVLKIFPYKLISIGYKDQLVNYLKDYKILTINRNPFDACLSFCYQIHTRWKTPHRINNEFYISKPFNVKLRRVSDYVEMYKINTNFLREVNVFKSFEYQDLTVDNLETFFGVKNSTPLSPININYRDLILNLDQVEEVFNNEMYGT